MVLLHSKRYDICYFSDIRPSQVLYHSFKKFMSSLYKEMYLLSTKSDDFRTFFYTPSTSILFLHLDELRKASLIFRFRDKMRNLAKSI